MCVVSMITDHYNDKWNDYLQKQLAGYPGVYYVPPSPPPITPEEIAEFRQLLERAREYDKRTGQPDCELDSKKAAIKKVAELLGVKIDFL